MVGATDLLRHQPPIAIIEPDSKFQDSLLSDSEGKK
jgi:hypothetical protein